jgi:hypothetical protein
MTAGQGGSRKQVLHCPRKTNVIGSKKNGVDTKKKCPKTTKIIRSMI